MMATAVTPPAEGGHDVLAADGRIVRIRPVAARDAAGLQALYERASDRKAYSRFFSFGPGLISREVTRLTRPPGPDHLAVVAVDGGRLVGAASYERLPHRPGAESTLLVADAEQGRGIGTLLLEELTRRAHANGVTELTGEVHVEDAPMVRVARDPVPGGPPQSAGGAVQITVPTTTGEKALAVFDLGDGTAERRALRPLLAPASVAVVGASRRCRGVGYEVLGNLREHGFPGPVYLVNPHATRIAGLPVYPRLTALPGPVDLAVVAVPTGSVQAVLDDAGAAGIRAVVVLTAGFAEAGLRGATAQAALVRTARAHDIRLVGPGSLGVVNTDPAVRLAATVVASIPPPGGLAVASQSGAVGVAVLAHAAATGVGIATFVSLGDKANRANRADVCADDLLAYWYDDPATRAVALYLESFGNPRRFARIARAVARRKPVLAVHPGRAAGTRTASAAASGLAVDSLFAQAGVIRTDTLGELLDAARLLVDQPLPAGNRIGIIGNSGGLNVLAADAAEATGLSVPNLPGGNPTDLGPAGPAATAAAVTRLAASDQINAIVAIFTATRAGDTPGTLTAIADAVDAAASVPVSVPVVVVLVGLPDPPAALGRRRAPVFPLPEPAVRALGHAARYAAWRREPLGRRPDLPDVASAPARSLVTEALIRGGGWQPTDDTIRLLGCYGIPVRAGALARDVDEAVKAAERLGYPVAVTAADPAITRKAERGLIRLHLGDAPAVRDAYLAITTALGDPHATVIDQPAPPGAVELTIGVVHDHQFGSLITLGFAGPITDLLGDRAVRLLPLTDLDATRMWRSLRGAPLLTGYRGASPVDTAALEDLLLRVGRLAEDLPEAAELDLNPVLAHPHGAITLDANLRLTPIRDEPDPSLRALPEPTRGRPTGPRPERHKADPLALQIEAGGAVLVRSARPVVAALDGGVADRAVARLAAAQASLHRVPLLLIGTADTATSGRRSPAPAPSGGASALTMARRLRGGHPSLRIDCDILPGPLADALIEGSRAATLIVIASHPDRTPSGSTLDAMTAQIVAHAACPVMITSVVSAAAGGPVLLCVGDPIEDPAVVGYAFAEAAARRMPLLAAHVWPQLPGGALDGVDPFAYDAAAAAEDADRLLSETLAGWTTRYPDVAVHRWATHDPDVVRAIVRLSADAGLVVVGARRNPDFSGRLVGPVPAALIGRTWCPLAIVPVDRRFPTPG